MTVSWQGRLWEVRKTGEGGPGPNRWDERNVGIDARGDLRLELVRREGRWTCAELQTQERLGFGTYRFDLAGFPDRFAPEIVLGIFNYVTPDIGPDGTNEIDIEFARWGNPRYPVGNYTVWPTETGVRGVGPTSDTFPVAAGTEKTRHTFVWTPTEVRFSSRVGHADDGALLRSWRFAPSDPKRRIPQRPLPLHLNLWLFQGRSPSDGRPVSVRFQRFAYLPGRASL